MLKEKNLTPQIKSVKRGWAVLAVCAALLSGCATEQQTTATLGRLGDSASRIISGTLASNPKTSGFGTILAREIVPFSRTTIGQLLAEVDRKRAQEAAERAIAERDAAVQRTAAERNAETEQQLGEDLARGRSEAERARADQRAAEARERALREAMAQGSGPTVEWAGDARGSAQATGPVQVEGRTDCEQVREIAVIQGKEVRQVATFCRDPRTGGRVRV